MKEIERSLNAYVGERDAINSIAHTVNLEIQAVMNRYRNRLLKRLEALNKAKEALNGLIEQNKKSFRNPKTRELYGVKFGIRKQPDKLLIDDEEYTIKQIIRHHKALSTIMLETRVRVAKSALKTLSDSQLKKIGVAHQLGEACVVINDANSDPVTKMKNYLDVH